MDMSEGSFQSISNSDENINTPNHVFVDKNAGTCSEESGEDRNCSERQKHNQDNHPLLNHLILGIVFEHVIPRDLLACRGVCKTWNVATLPYTRLAFQIIIYGQTFHSSCGLPGLYYESDIKNPKEKLHTVQNFVDLFSSNTLGIPFGKFKLGAFPITDGVGQEFFKICGDTIQELSFFHDTETFRVEDVCELLKSTPKLQSLQIPRWLSKMDGNNTNTTTTVFLDKTVNLSQLKTIITSNYSKTLLDKQFCPFVGEIVSVAPNISNLTFCDEFKGSLEDHYPSLEVLKHIQKLGRASSIQTLSLSCLRSEHVEILSDHRNGFKLKKLTYSEIEPGVNAIKLITFFKDSLNVLDARGTSTEIFMEFSKMSHLTELSFRFEGHVLKSRCINLEKIFPALEKLQLYGFDDEERDEFFPQSNPCPRVKSLRLVDLYLKINGFKHIRVIFPNLTKLHFTISYNGAEAVRHIWSQMTQLEVLSLEVMITTMDDLDSLVTGICSQGIQEIRGLLNELERMTEGLRRETIQSLKNQYYQGPSITNLTKLKSLKLSVVGEDNNDSKIRRYLTDMTLYFGFYSMKTLKHLDVQLCGFTKTGCKILTDETELVSWAFKTPEYETILLYLKEYRYSQVQLQIGMQVPIPKVILYNNNDDFLKRDIVVQYFNQVPIL